VENIFVFSHIPKAAGSTITHHLRCFYGINHCRAHTDNSVYTPKYLVNDLKFYPRLKAISGHKVRAHVDFGEYENYMQWITMLREPISRFISQYRWWAKRHSPKMSFEEWCEAKGNQFANFQVKWIAGEDNIDKAGMLLKHKFIGVGDQNEFQKSMLIFNSLFGKQIFPTNNIQVNKSTIEGNFDLQLAERYNLLDLELYKYFRQDIWPIQLRKKPLETGLKQRIPRQLNRMLNLGYHVLIYKNFR